MTCSAPGSVDSRRPHQFRRPLVCALGGSLHDDESSEPGASPPLPPTPSAFGKSDCFHSPRRTRNELRERLHDSPGDVHARRPSRGTRGARTRGRPGSWAWNPGGTARRFRRVSRRARRRLVLTHRGPDPRRAPRAWTAVFCATSRAGRATAVRERRRRTRGLRVLREPVLIDPLIPRGRDGELVLAEGGVRGERGGIAGAEVARRRRGPCAVGGRGCGAWRARRWDPCWSSPDPTDPPTTSRFWSSAGERARRGCVVRAAVLGGEPEARQAQVRLHRDALGGRARGGPIDRASGAG